MMMIHTKYTLLLQHYNDQLWVHQHQQGKQRHRTPRRNIIIQRNEDGSRREDTLFFTQQAKRRVGSGCRSVCCMYNKKFSMHFSDFHLNRIQIFHQFFPGHMDKNHLRLFTNTISLVRTHIEKTKIDFRFMIMKLALYAHRVVFLIDILMKII